MGSDEAGEASESERPEARGAKGGLARSPSRAEAFEEDEEDGFDGPYDEPEGEHEEEDYEEGLDRRRRGPSAIAIALLVVFVALSIVGFLAQRTFWAPAEPEASGQAPGKSAAGPANPGALAPSEASEAPDAAPASDEGVEESGLTVSQEDDGQGGLYITIGDDTWHGKESPQAGASGDLLELEGPTALVINTGFETKDPKAVVDHGSFGVYEPGGGLMYATVQRTKALDAEEAETRGTYTVIGSSGERYSGSYVDSLPDPKSDRVIRTYTVEEGPAPGAGAGPEKRSEAPKPEVLRVAYELSPLKDDEGEGPQGRPFVPQLVGWHAPDGTKLIEIVEARR